VTGTVIKSSSGAIFHIPLIKVSNIQQSLEVLKKNYFFVYALTGDGETSLHTAVFDTKVAFVVGGEGSGVREKIKEGADFRIFVPINKACESLNASNAVAVALYEWEKQQSDAH
jgi:23S rRNA (guanosine2251-2'-O)-methyltransferase